jgi:hypothetical protein
MKKDLRKLSLQRETLAALQPEALEGVQGGNADVALPRTQYWGCQQQTRVSLCMPTLRVVCASIGGGR